MKIKLLFLILLIFFQAKSQTISDDSKISLITVGPGNQLYSTFGHSAIRIIDNSQGIDRAYHYGAFDFNTPNFYIKFMRGQLPYCMSVDDFTNEIPQWQYENRLVTEQVLNLSPEQKREIFKTLNINYLPQNKYYNYKFFYDNCSTRIGDLFQKILKDSVQFSNTLNQGKSYRNWIDSCSKYEKPWSDFGMDVAIGLPSDTKASAKQATFLPMNLMASFDSASIFRNGKKTSLIQSKNNISFVMPYNSEEIYFTPQKIGWLIFVVGFLLTVFQTFKNNSNFIFDKLIFTLTSLAGIVILLLWFGTNHGVTERNFNLIWAFPLSLIAVFATKRKWSIIYFLVYGIVQVILLISWKIIPQEINTALQPIVLLLMVRSLYIVYIKTNFWFPQNLDQLYGLNQN